MNVDEIKIAFAKNIELTATPVSAYIQLPVGVHIIGDKKYTVSEVIKTRGKIANTKQL